MFERGLERLWDAARLPPRRHFDPRDDAQLNTVSRHLLRAYWRFHDVEAFAGFCALTRGALAREARGVLGAEADAQAVRELVDAALGALFLADPGRAPCVLHLRAYVRGWMERQRAGASCRPAERLGPLAAVE